MIKRIKILGALVTSSLFGDTYPNGTPLWANFEDIVVAQTIAGEARGESSIGQAMVADVIYTRMILKNKNAYDIVSEPNQFEGFEYRGDVPDYIWTLTLKLKHKIDILPKTNYTQFRAHRITSMPSWGIDPLVVGNHVFFNEE